MGEDYISMYFMRLSDRITKFEEQWKGTRFAAIDESATFEYEEELDENEQDQEFLEKYRCKNGDIKPLGLILYKKYLNKFFLLFLVLFIVFIPVALIYSHNTGLKQLESLSLFSKAVLFTSIANLPHYRLDILTPNNILTINFHRSLAVTTDILAIILVFFFLIWLKAEVSKTTLEYNAKSPAPNLYCLELTNIEGCNEEDILTHFSKFGQVAQVSGIYTHKNIIFELRKIVKMVNHMRFLKPDELEFEKTVEKMRVKYEELAAAYFQMPKPSLKSIFVCFEHIKDRNRIYDLYKYKINPKKIYFKIHQQSLEKYPSFPNDEHFKNIEVSAERFYNESKEKIISPIVSKCKFEPLTINWENCDINKESQKIKFLCQFLLLVTVTFVILLGLFIIHIGSSQMREQYNNIETLQSWSQEKTEKRERYTFCASLSLSDLKWEYYNVCAEYFQLERNRFILMLMFALMVSVINLLTNRILWALVAFRRYRTLAERNSFLITSIFLFSVINSAVMILFIRDSYIGPILRDIVAWLCGFNKDNLNVTVYSEYNRKWYGSIGSQLAMNYIVSLIVFPFFHIFLHWIRLKYREFASKRSNRPRKKPILNYCTFYALSLKGIFFTLMYSNSMPIFYLLGCLGLGVQRIVVKVLLRKFVDEPVFVDNQAIHVATNLIPYALILHCFTSFMFLDVEDIFPNLYSYQNIQNGIFEAFLLKSQRGSLYIILIVLLLTFIFFRERIERKIFQYWFGKTENKAESNQVKKFKDIKTNPAFLASYKMKDNPKYKVLSYALQLFCHHMESIRIKGGIEMLSDGSAFNTTKMFREENTLLQYRKSPSTELMKNQNEYLGSNRNEIMNDEIMVNELLEEEVDSEEEPNEEWEETDETNKETISNHKEMDDQK